MNLAISSPVREQFTILTSNIETLLAVGSETEIGSVKRKVALEVASQVAALGELRERAYQVALLGGLVVPLERAPSLVEVLDLS